MKQIGQRHKTMPPQPEKNEEFEKALGNAMKNIDMSTVDELHSYLMFIYDQGGPKKQSARELAWCLEDAIELVALSLIEKT